jgi:hypothetical protein
MTSIQRQFEEAFRARTFWAFSVILRLLVYIPKAVENH